MTATALPVTLVTGPSAAAREAAIEARLAATGQGGRVAVILEGLPDPRASLTASSACDVQRIAPGCVCCTGNLVLRVTLNRVLRRRPTQLFLGLANTEHLDQLRSWLQQAPYDQLLALTPDLST